MAMTRSVSTLTISCFLWLFAASASGLEADSEQPVSWSSDGGSMTRIENAVRIVEINDNVSVTQGTLEIRGNQAIIELDAETGEMLRVTVTGTPVNYQQQLDEEGGLVTGTSDRMLMYSEDNGNETVLEFIGNAYVTSPDTTMNCAAILYRANQNLFNGTGPCQGSLVPGNN